MACHVTSKKNSKQMQYLVKKKIAERYHFVNMQLKSKKKRKNKKMKKEILKFFVFSPGCRFGATAIRDFSSCFCCSALILKIALPTASISLSLFSSMVQPTDKKFLLFRLPVSARKRRPRAHLCKAMPSPAKRMEKS